MGPEESSRKNHLRIKKYLLVPLDYFKKEEKKFKAKAFKSQKDFQRGMTL